MSKVRLFPFLFVFLLAACTSDTNRETPTQGNIQIAADPSVIRITQEFADGFNFLYQNARVEVQSLKESEAINALLDAQVSMIVIPGVIPAEQEKALRAQNFTARYQPLALDALALIVHPQNSDTLLSPTILRQILSGKISNWNQLTPQSSNGKIQIILDAGGSSLANYLRDSVMRGEGFLSEVLGAGSNPELVNQVANTPGALGFIGLNWISSTKDSLSKELLKSVRIVRVQNEEDKQFYLPFQSSVGIGKYPFIRKINAITFEAKTGLVAGFIAFCAGEKGQRMVLKSGLMPAYRPTRNIELR